MTRALLCLVIAACSAPIAPTNPSRVPLELAWSMTLDGDRVRIDYTVTNHTGERVVLLDRLRSTTAASDLAVVRASEHATVAFTLAYVPPAVGDSLDLRPLARHLDPGATAVGTRYAAWPLRAQHNTSTAPPELPSSIDGVILEVGYVTGAVALERVAGVEVPDAAALRSQKILRSAVRSLPVPTMPVPTESPVELVWTPVRDGARVRIDYTVRNRGSRPIALCDRMRDTNGPTDDAVVHASGVDGVVAFTMAFVRPVRTNVERQPRPIARVLAENESVTGVAYVDLPIRASHPLYLPQHSLPPRFDYAVFEIGYVDDVALESETARGQTFAVPSWGALQTQHLVRGEMLRLP